MTQHTPGPWTTEQLFTLYGTPKNEWYVTGQDRDDDPYSGVVVFSDAGVNGEANARLIAAAPDLLAACKLAYETMLQAGNDLGWSDNALRNFAKVGNRLRDVIANAQGDDNETQ